MKKYTEPQIADYGSIAEMTAGRSFRENSDTVIPNNTNLKHQSTGPCYVGPGPGGGCAP
jgi:hypothetical protein